MVSSVMIELTKHADQPRKILPLRRCGKRQHLYQESWEGVFAQARGRVRYNTVDLNRLGAEGTVKRLLRRLTELYVFDVPPGMKGC